MYKSNFTLSDGDKVFGGYTDGTEYNGWASVYFTREQVSKWLDTSPYDYRFLEPHSVLNKKDYPVLLIYFEDEEEIESTPFYADELGDLVEGYCLDGYEFMEVI